MSDLMQEAIEALQQDPEKVQDARTAWLLKVLASERSWMNIAEGDMSTTRRTHVPPALRDTYSHMQGFRIVCNK